MRITSFERTLGFPSREVDVVESMPQFGGLAHSHEQNGAAQVWYDYDWHFYDPWNSRTTTVLKDKRGDILSFKDLITKTSYKYYRAFYAFDKRTSQVWTGKNYQGHNFAIKPNPFYREPEELSQWKFLDEGPKSEKSNVIIAGSPIKMLVKDNQGRMVGSTDTGIVNEIPDAKYMPPGQIGYSNRGDPSTAFELDEFISIPEGLNGKYELIVTGTGDGEYSLQFAKFDPSSENEYSGVTTFTDTIKKDEVRRYDVNIDDSSIKFSYRFTGFFQPVENLPSWNSVNAGRAVPTKFSLSGYQGLDFLFSEMPTVVLCALRGLCGECFLLVARHIDNTIKYMCD